MKAPGNQSQPPNPTLSRILFASFLLLIPIEILLRTFNFSPVIDLINFGLTIVGLIFAAIQANILDLRAISLPRINSRWLLLLVCTLLIISAVLNTVLLTSHAIGIVPPGTMPTPKTAVPAATASATSVVAISPPSPTTPSTTPSPIIASTTPTSCPSFASGDAASRLIPCSSPVIDDPMNDPTNKNGWERGNQSNGSCDYVTGATTSYHLTAPANQGIGCWSTNQNMVFSNFVYQVKMTIVKGVNNGGSGTGPMFRISSNQGNGYQVSFNAVGAWCAWVNTNGSSTSLKCASDTTNFHTGIGQSNYLTIKAQDEQFDVQINGHTLYSFTDSSYLSGYIGFQLGPGTQDSDVIFSDVKVWQV